MQVRIANSLDEVPGAEWNLLAGGRHPFLRHEFLSALERQGCLGERTGWWPNHLLLREGGELLGALPLYLKHNSFGEFVFDWGWADAYARAGLPYYPKLVAAVPFTPVTGPRLLAAPGARRGEVAATLARAALACARQNRLSSLHCLFTDEQDTRALAAEGLLLRTGCQFHWHNPGYRDFDDFLAALTSKKRKQIRRERREAAASGLQVRLLRGDQVSESQWEAYHRFYASTFDRKWGMPSLTPGFFKEIGGTMPEAVLLALASDGPRPVAGAFFLRGRDALFGRHWGCSEYHRALHFEVCYYRAIEYCIAEGLSRFEAGAQGEHKLSRGFLPSATRSAHWIADPAFAEAIGEFLVRERRAIDAYIEEMAGHSPFRCSEPRAAAPAGGVRATAGGR